MNTQRREWVTMFRVLVLSAWAFSYASPAQADPLLRPDHGHDAEIMQAVHKAQHEVDRAWEVFHKAALGGTLASPAVQADVEQALHESRGLLVKAREAADRGDRATLQPLLDRIHTLTKRAITESQEQKR
jgi:hypothetical protein